MWYSVIFVWCLDAAGVQAKLVATETVKKNMVSIRRDTLAISILDPYIRFESNRKNLTGELLQTWEVV